MLTLAAAAVVMVLLGAIYAYGVLLPALIFSGFMFPVSSMPQAFQYLTLVNPVRHFLEVVRAVFLKGTGAGDHVPQFLALYGMAAAGLWLGVRRFRGMVE
jgi:ABC-2 type transport system permease protein